MWASLPLPWSLLPQTELGLTLLLLLLLLKSAQICSFLQGDREEKRSTSRFLKALKLRPGRRDQIRGV